MAWVRTLDEPGVRLGLVVSLRQIVGVCFVTPLTPLALVTHVDPT